MILKPSRLCLVLKNIRLICGGYQFRSMVIRHGGGVFEIDILHTYKDAVKRLNRKFTVGDSFEFDDNKSHDITELFVSVVKPEIKGGKAAIENMILECEETPEIRSEGLKNHFGQDDILYFIDYHANESFRIKSKLKLD